MERGKEGEREGDRYRTVSNSLHRPAAMDRQRLLIGVWDKTDHSNVCKGG